MQKIINIKMIDLRNTESISSETKSALKDIQTLLVGNWFLILEYWETAGQFIYLAEYFPRGEHLQRAERPAKFKWVKLHKRRLEGQLRKFLVLHNNEHRKNLP